jgi:hypothetical protein
MDEVKFSGGHCIGTASNGNDWAWAKSGKKITINGKKVSMFYALEVVSAGTTVKQIVRETFLDKTEAVKYCADRCETMY